MADRSKHNTKDRIVFNKDKFDRNVLAFFFPAPLNTVKTRWPGVFDRLNEEFYFSPRNTRKRIEEECEKMDAPGLIIGQTDLGRLSKAMSTAAFPT
jgi:hypothetical protein